jgi:hypothetical protein
MAKMYPNQIPDHIARDKGRGAELRIYHLLSEQLPETFACYYSRPWHRFTPDGNEQDGEADFVIAHAEYGMLVIEVKGGRVTCRAGDGQWVSRDRHDIEYDIKNPVEQAKKSKYRLLDFLKNSRDWKPRRIHNCHGVMLPDNARPQRALGADAPLEMFAFGNDLSNLGAWVQQRMQASGQTGDTGLGRDGMEAIHKILAAKFELRPHLARSLSDDIRHIERLTAEQSWILDSLEGNPQMAVSGAAGTGKTMLALEKSLRSAASGKRTVFVCFNNALAFHLKALAGDHENLTVSSFHALCGSLARQAAISLPDKPGNDFYTRLLPEALLSSMDARSELRFETIIIDEGQDFTDDWLDCLRLCLAQPEEGEFYVFHDDNQRIFTSDRRFLAAIPKAKYRLNRNLRNTRSIHRALAPWYDSRKVLPVGPEGERVEWIECRDQQQAYAKAASLIADFLRTKQLDPAQIAVLTGAEREKCSLFAQDRLAGCYIIRADEPGHAQSVIGDTVRRFKGLEAKCVILIDIDQLVKTELIYVALSRPAVLLCVLGSRTEIGRLKGESSS